MIKKNLLCQIERNLKYIKIRLFIFDTRIKQPWKKIIKKGFIYHTYLQCFALDAAEKVSYLTDVCVTTIFKQVLL